MGAGDRERAYYRLKQGREFEKRDWSANRPAAGDEGRVRIGRFASRARYPGWTFTVGCAGKSAWLEAFGPDPADPKTLRKLGPWPVPEDAGEEEIFALVLDAVASVDGEDARARVAFLPAK